MDLNIIKIGIILRCWCLVNKLQRIELNDKKVDLNPGVHKSERKKGSGL